MKKTVLYLLVFMLCIGLLAGCQSGKDNDSSRNNTGKQDSIPFEDGQYYAVAYLGYQQIEDLDYYTKNYLDSDKIPVHYISSGEYYLVIPRYSEMELKLYKNDFDTSQPALIYEDPDCEPFIIQCNASDIFADATIKLSYKDDNIEFSPYISLENGSVYIGQMGLNITKSADEAQ